MEETRWARAQAAISHPVSEHSQALLKLELKEAKKEKKKKSQTALQLGL